MEKRVVIHQKILNIKWYSLRISTFRYRRWCCLLSLLRHHSRVREIAYGFGGPSEKKCQSSLIFCCKIPILCQSLAKSAQILLVMSDRTDTFRELCHRQTIGIESALYQTKKNNQLINLSVLTYTCMYIWNFFCFTVSQTRRI